MIEFAGWVAIEDRQVADGQSAPGQHDLPAGVLPQEGSRHGPDDNDARAAVFTSRGVDLPACRAPLPVALWHVRIDYRAPAEGSVTGRA